MNPAVRVLALAVAGRVALGRSARSVAVAPRICDVCGRTATRLTPSQRAAMRARRLPACRRLTCRGSLRPAGPSPERVAELLAEALEGHLPPGCVDRAVTVAAPLVTAMATGYPGGHPALQTRPGEE
ncbi:hypothetical protein ACFHW2_12135 [Actinomadura sp. LOL_016]|uniref:hypothetical protein n=1 Tax=unclassified Actinomadura TaxID=2626254 RepID=UPI003A801CA9